MDLPRTWWFYIVFCMFTRGYVPRYVQKWLINVTWLLFWTMVTPRVSGEFIPRRLQRHLGSRSGFGACHEVVTPQKMLINPIDLWYICHINPRNPSEFEPTSLLNQSCLENPSIFAAPAMLWMLWGSGVPQELQRHEAARHLRMCG